MGALFSKTISFSYEVSRAGYGPLIEFDCLKNGDEKLFHDLDIVLLTEDEEANNDSVKCTVHKKILVLVGCWGLSGLFRLNLFFIIGRGFSWLQLW